MAKTTMKYILRKRPEYCGHPLLLFSNNQGGGADQPHGHDFIEIGLVRQGWASHYVYQKGEQEPRVQSIIRRDLYIASPGVVHQFREKHDVLLYTMAFQNELLRPEELEILSRQPVFRQILKNRHGVITCLHLLPLEFSYAEELLRKIMMELHLSRGEDIHWLLARTLAVEYLIFIGNHTLMEERRTVAVTDPRIMQAMEDMEAEPQKSWSLESMARRYGMCPSGFGRKFREVAGLPPMKYCQFLRIEQVQRELLYSDTSVEMLAMQYHFSDSNHLVKVFKKHCGITPLAYRHRAREFPEE